MLYQYLCYRVSSRAKVSLPFLGKCRELQLRFNFGQVERALALTYNIPDDKRSAFASRLKHLQKLGFPPGINTGRGVAATYNAAHLYLLGLALELSQLGLNPERATRVIAENVHSIAKAASIAAASSLPDGRFDLPMLLYFNPAVVSAQMGRENPDDRACQTFHYGGLGQATEHLQKWFAGGLQRVAFLSVSALLYGLASHSRRNPQQPMTDFYREIEAWADPLIRNVEYSLEQLDQLYWDTDGTGDHDNGNS